MTLSLTAATANFGRLDTPLLVLALPSSPTVAAELQPVDKATNGAITRAVSRRDFRGGRDETLHLAGGDARRPARVARRAWARRPIGRRRCVAPAPSPARQASTHGRRPTGVLRRRADARRKPRPRASGSIAGVVGLQRNENAAAGRRSSAHRSTARRSSSRTDGASINGASRRRARSAKGIRSRADSACCRATSARPTISPTPARDIATRHGMEVTVLGRAEMEREKMGIVPLRRAGHAAGSEAHRARVQGRRQGRDAGRRSSARDSASTPAASPSSPRRAWSG